MGVGVATAAGQIGHQDVDYLNVASQVLTSGKTSRLYKRLVYDDQVATQVSSFAFPLEIAGIFGIQATARPGVDLAVVESAIEEELSRFLEEGPTEDELRRVKSQMQAGLM